MDRVICCPYCGTENKRLPKTVCSECDLVIVVNEKVGQIERAIEVRIEVTRIEPL